MADEEQWEEPEPAGPPPSTDPDAPEIDEEDPYAKLHAMRAQERPKLQGPLNRDPNDLLEPVGARDGEEDPGYWDDVEDGGRAAGRPRRAGAIPRPTGRRGRERGAERGASGSPKRRRQRRSFQVGEVIGKSFSTWGSNLLPFALITAVVLSPAIMINILFAAMPPEEGNIGAVVGFAGVMAIVTAVLQQVATAALIYGVFQHLRSQPVSFGDCIQRGLAKLLPVIGVGIVAGLLIWIPLIPALLVGGVAAASGTRELIAVAVLLGLIGLPFLIFLSLSLQPAVSAAVVENLGVFEAIKRSFQLSKGERGAIFGVLFVIGIVSAMIGGVVGGSTALADPVVKACAEQLLSLFTVSLGATVAAVIYHDLRVAKEGIETHELASVFD